MSDSRRKLSVAYLYEILGVKVRHPRHEPEEWEIGDTYPVDSPLCGAVNHFFYAVLALRDNFRKVTAGLDLDAEKAKRDWDAFLAQEPQVKETAGRRTGDRRFAFDAHPVKQPPYLFALRRHYETAHLAEMTSYSMLLSLVAQYDAFLGQLLRCLFAVQPQLLRRSEKVFTWSEVVDLPEISAVQSLVVEREVESLLKQGHVDQLTELERRLGIDTLKKFGELGDLVEIVERRNLVAHTGSKISIQYVRQCAKYNITPGGEPGDVLVIDHEYFMHACNTMITVGVKLAQTVWRHVVGNNKDSLEFPDSHLAYITYTLLVHEDWELAQKLLKFATELKKLSSDQRKYVFLVNYAQTFKWLGNNNSCAEILQPHEWGTLDIAFRISSAVLKDDFDEAGELMQYAATTGQVARTAFEHWPIYREFRKSPQFANSYQKAYGTDWVDRSVAGAQELDRPPNARLPQGKPSPALKN
jgi:hypothetical protein